MNKNFNLILAGVGGQGLITLVNLVTEAAFIDGYDVKSSELHGLSQRGGSVLAHIRFGKKVYSPLIEDGRADLIIALEETEGSRALNFANKNTAVLANKHFVPTPDGWQKEEVEKKLQETTGKNLHLVDASEICKKELQNEVVSGIYLLGYAINKKLMPITEKSLMGAIEKIISEKHLELNKRAVKLANNI